MLARDKQAPSASNYADLEAFTAEILKLAEGGHWEDAAVVAEQLETKLYTAAKPADRSAIEAALRNIQEISERAIPLRQDLANLLKAFGPPLPKD